MSRFSVRSAAMLGVVAAPLAAHFYAAHPGSSSLTEQTAQHFSSGSYGSASQRAQLGHSAPKVSTAVDSPGIADVDGASVSAQQEAQSSLNDAVCSFLEEYSGWQPATGSSAPDQLSCKQPSASTGGLPRVVIATVANPIRTHLQLRFDRAVDDIQDIAQQRGWEFDSDWLPWDNHDHEESGRYGERLLDSTAQHAREHVPGALLFRPGIGAADQPTNTEPVKGKGLPGTGVVAAEEVPSQAAQFSAASPLIVLLAGETPTGGIDGEQFKAVLKMWQTLQPGAAGNELDILGPSFSGSVQSLLRLLGPEFPTDAGVNKSAKPTAKANEPCLRVRITAGSVSRGDQLAALANTLCGPNEVVSFAPDMGYQTCALLRFLKKTDGPVAVVTEGETTFGDRDHGDQSKKQNKKASNGCPEPGAALQFPREISRLREAYEQNGIVGFAVSDSSPRSELSFETVTTQHGSDTVPSFSGTESTLSMESQMAAIAVTLNQERVSTVLLSATDIFDEVFVARYLEQHAPRVAVIIQDADLLFLRRGTDAGLPDTYVETPWPLIPKNQEWTGGSRGNLPQYLSQNDQGLRAAAIHLFPCRKETCPSIPEYRSPLSGPEGLQQRPPLWLSIISRGRFAPIALLDSDKLSVGTADHNLLPAEALTGLVTGLSQKPVPASEPSAARGLEAHVPLLSKLLMAGIAGLLIWHGLACIFSRIDRRFAWSYALADAPHNVVRLLLQVALSLAVIPAVLLLLIPNAPGLTITTGLFYAVGYLLQFLGIVSAMYSLARLWELKPRLKKARVTHLGAIFVVLCLLTALVDFGLRWVFVSGHAGLSSKTIFSLYRSALMEPGISPFFTLLLSYGALVYWLHSRFARLAFFGHRIPALPEGYEHRHCPSPKSLRPVTDLFTNPLGRTHWIIALVAALCVGTVLALSNSGGPSTLDGGWFQIIVRCATAVISLIILVDTAVAAWGWHLLREYCLLELKRSPLRWGFSWIQGFSWKRIWTGARVLSSDILFDYLSRILEANHRAELFDPDLDGATKALRHAYYHPRVSRFWSEVIVRRFYHLHATVAKAARYKLGELDSLWVKDEGPLTGPDSRPESEHMNRRGLHLLEPLEDLKGGAVRKQALDRMAREEFVALLYVGFIRMVLIQIRNRILTALICYVLLLWALTSYSWTNHHAVILAMSALLALLSSVVVYIYSGMHRDDILSRTTETESGKLDSEFFEKTIPTLGIPLFSLIATQFPEFSDLIFSFIEPGLRGH